MHAKIWVWFFFDHVYFVSRLTGPTYINIIGWKMTALIDMPTPVKKKVQTKIWFQIDKHQILEALRYHSKSVI